MECFDRFPPPCGWCTIGHFVFVFYPRYLFPPLITSAATKKPLPLRLFTACGTQPSSASPNLGKVPWAYISSFPLVATQNLHACVYMYTTNSRPLHCSHLFNFEHGRPKPFHPIVSRRPLLTSSPRSQDGDRPPALYGRGDDQGVSGGPGGSTQAPQSGRQVPVEGVSPGP